MDVFAHPDFEIVEEEYEIVEDDDKDQKVPRHFIDHVHEERDQPSLNDIALLKLS